MREAMARMGNNGEVQVSGKAGVSHEGNARSDQKGKLCELLCKEPSWCNWLWTPA